MNIGQIKLNLLILVTFQNLELKNTNIIEPLSGILAAELKKHNIYVTGSLNEPSGNHHIEAAQCGLYFILIVEHFRILLSLSSI